jgi:hypothetical protein
LGAIGRVDRSRACHRIVGCAGLTPGAPCGKERSLLSLRRFDLAPADRDHWKVFPPFREEKSMGSLVKKRRKKMSKHKYRKRLKANRHKRKK